LVTHRALAKQKFDDFKSLFLSNFLSGNPASLVLATGDSVEDSEGEFPPEPLKASLLVATYEKYLAMLSASGVPRDMSNTVVVCDEIQLIGDKNRGQNVEILLTLLRNAGWRQFVGLSAVLPSRDAHDLADWLGVQLIMKATREKHLSYRTAFSVTLCHPGVDPSVAPVVAACGRLCVVESVDLGEALLRYCEGSLSNDQLYRWLATPGQALAADLPFVERV
jgi:helicase